MLNHNKSDGLLVQSNSKVMIIDVGNGFSGIYNQGIAGAADLRATEIEVIMLTHLHSSHAGTLDSVFSKNIVRTLIMPKEDSDAFVTVSDVCKKHGVAMFTYTHGDSIVFEDATVYTSPHGYIKRSTQPVIRLDISAFGESFTYLGGAYFEAAPNTPLSGTDNVWFGNHGPLYKKEFCPEIPEECSVFAGESAKDFLSPDIYADGSQYVILD